MSIKLVDLVRVDQASRFSTGVFRVRLGANTRGICTNTQSYSAETLGRIEILENNVDR